MAELPFGQNFDYDFHRMLNEHSHTVTVDHVPDWLSSGDIVEKRGERYFAVSLTKTIPRWRSLLNRFIHWIRSL